ncbi:Metalloexopeptidase [Suhomyces tanzawaensis NRRL Y-17324]|uniref:Metalloexopeptidase n=1 Tax=Suhomyces tanzawaensis NRRL Y-17324 TaxID=984487 RepID=A0A1E4SPH8_9ASCO|nr:Metalloexopeptidase [Suhomyces tanzawaensis NRRL Y-17324]ODV81396.1 Metalloexopeptidase [Suhomyces tanzawaensis NRRL Y-17324]
MAQTPPHPSRYSRGIIHEGEYVLKPYRSLPINYTSTPDPINSRPSSSTPIRLNPSNLTAADLSLDEPELAAPYPFSTSPLSISSGSTGTTAPSDRDISGSPKLVHKWSHSRSILCVIPAPKKKLLFCGTQDSKILVYDMVDFALKYEASTSPHDHPSSVLCLDISEDENFLFSAGSDSLVKVWDLSNVDASTQSETNSASELIHCTHVFYSLVDIGDIFSIAWCESVSVLFIGAQNASVLWCKLCLLPAKNAAPAPLYSSIERLPHFRYDKFFDSKGPGGSINTLQSKHQLLRKNSSSTPEGQFSAKIFEVSNEDLIRFAHNGYVYCMSIYTPKLNSITGDNRGPYLITCGGDGIINVWSISVNQETGKTKLFKIKSLENQESILSMSIQDYLLYVGLSDSSINVWDLSTFQLVRSFHFKDPEATSTKLSYDEVLSLGIYNDCIFKASNLGGLVKFTIKGQATSTWSSEEDKGNNREIAANDIPRTRTVITLEDDPQNVHLFNYDHKEEMGAVLAVSIFSDELGATYLLSGGHKALCLWEISNIGAKNSNSIECTLSKSTPSKEFASLLSNEHLLKALHKFTSFKTISKFPSLYLEDSRHCAQFLGNLFTGVGAHHTKLLPVTNGNPIVYACFKGNANGNGLNPRVLWYAHYDVVDATNSEATDWSTDPFVLTAKDGNLYARGVSDNKGPTLAAIYAVAELYHSNQLSTDVVFIIEGEEECGSIGFQKVINEHKSLIGEIDWVMLSNSYWLDDETPCLNYGLRGVINASVTVRSDKPDRHSGVDGGILKEPTMDLIQILSQLVDPETEKIQLEGFYDDVLPLTAKEVQLYQDIEKTALDKNINNHDLQSLMAKWRNPSLTVHKIQVSGPNNNTVIPQVTKATISIRIVPNQNLESIKQSLVEFLEAKFKKLKSDNHLLVNIFHEAEPWLGNPTNQVYKVLYEKIKDNWGVEPLFIREGGSIPSIRFLEKCFDAPAAQIPCGQASDNAHLKNEKLRIVNLYKLRSVLTDTLRELGLNDHDASS